MTQSEFAETAVGNLSKKKDEQWAKDQKGLITYHVDVVK